MILPRPRPIMCRAHAWATLKTLETLMRISRSKSSGGKSSSGVRCCTPALLTTMSIGPVECLEAVDRRGAAAWSVTSKASRSAPGSSTRPRASPRSRPLSTTDAPASASPRASARPIPCEEPVTSARRPARSNRPAISPANRVRPPSTRSTWPLMNFDCGPARNATASAISSGSA